MVFGKKRRHSIFGIYNDQASLDHTIEILKSQNFRNSDISVLIPSHEGSEPMAIEKSTKATEGATTGALTGLLAGGAFGWLLGAGALAIPTLGPFIAAGPIMAAIAGAGLGGSFGGIAGGLIGLGFPEYEAERFEGLIKKGGMLISIHVDDAKWEAKAHEILEENGAEHISTTSEKRSPEQIYFHHSADLDFNDKHL